MFQLKLHTADDFGFSTENRNQNENLPEKNTCILLIYHLLDQFQFFYCNRFVHRTFLITIFYSIAYWIFVNRLYIIIFLSSYINHFEMNLFAIENRREASYLFYCWIHTCVFRITL